MEREAAEAERKRKEEEEALARAAHEAAEKEAAIARRRQEKAMALGAEPEKGPDVTQVCFPSVFKFQNFYFRDQPLSLLIFYFINVNLTNSDLFGQ